MPTFLHHLVDGNDVAMWGSLRFSIQHSCWVWAVCLTSNSVRLSLSARNTCSSCCRAWPRPRATTVAVCITCTTVPRLVAEGHMEDGGFLSTGRTNIEGCLGAQQDVSALQNCHDIGRGLLFHTRLCRASSKSHCGRRRTRHLLVGLGWGCQRRAPFRAQNR